MNKIYILVGLLILVIGAIIFLQLQSNQNSAPQPTPPSTSSPTIISTPRPSTEAQQPEPGVSYQTILPDEQAVIDRDATVGRLLDKLPHQGSNFSLSYNFSTFQFILTIKSGNQEAGYTEFDEYLRANQIMDRSWLKNLLVNIEN